MTEPNEVRAIVANIKAKRSNWRVSKRDKNRELVSILAVPQSEILDMIYSDLSWHNYSSGPKADNHTPQLPGDIWIFGLTISGIDCYLKFQDRPSGVVMWISIHPVEYPLNMPFRWD
ncbi:hypothetical protein D8911_02285 [Levilactobacillus brevis]|nr:hypothetical protein D8911_02285 [Levilactobacillus brevis]